MQTITKVLWVGVMFSVGIGVFVLIVGLSAAQTVMQEATSISLGIAFGVLPYVFTRAFAELSN